MKTYTITIRILILVVLLAASTSRSEGQTEHVNPPVSTYQFRKVPTDKIDEFIKRQTTYSAEVARKAMLKGNLTFWGLFEKVGGNNLENAPNFLSINTYQDINAVGEIWNFRAAFPNVPMDKIETESISKPTALYFVREKDFILAPGSDAPKDFQYVEFVFHNAPDAAAFMALETKHWAPFVKSAMEKQQTTELAWGNAGVLSPRGTDVPFSSISFDIFPDLKSAVNQWWDEKVVFPTDGLAEITKMEAPGRSAVIYKIIKVVAPEPVVGNR